MSTFGPYSPIFNARDLYFISGQIGVDPKSITSAIDVQVQTKQALENMKSILLENGLSMNNVVKTTVFLADMADFAEMNAIYETFFDVPRPARSTVAVKELPRVGTNKLLVEIEAVAIKQATNTDITQKMEIKE